MAEFIGYPQGCRGEVHRLGSKKSGITSRLKTWDSEIRTSIHLNDNGKHVLVVDVNGKEKLRLDVE
jgi:hypothetical protein